MPRPVSARLFRTWFGAVLLLTLSGCAGMVDDSATTGNMVEQAVVTTPKDSRWFTGRLTVEPAGSGRACLLLEARSGTYVLRSATDDLTTVAWQNGGVFDATLSGVARDNRVVLPYDNSKVRVRGGVIAAADVTCAKYPTLGFTKVSRKAPKTSADQPTPTTAPGPTAKSTTERSSETLVQRSDLVWKRGTLILVAGNEGQGNCLALKTTEGAYAVSSATHKLDAIIEYADDSVNPQTTGLHIHGRGPLGMAAVTGQEVELRGWLSDNTDLVCSKYLTLSVVEVRK